MSSASNRPEPHLEPDHTPPPEPQLAAHPVSGGGLPVGYVDVVLDAVDGLVAQARATSLTSWQLLATHARAGADRRSMIILGALRRATDIGRGPLLQVALGRIHDRGQAQLHELPDLERAIAVESLMTALIAATQRDLLTDSDLQTLLEPLHAAAAITLLNAADAPTS